MKQLFKQYEGPVAATIHLLELLKMPVSDDDVNDFILSHPDYPSMLAVSDALHHWKVENAAVRGTRETIDQFPLPFISYNLGDFRVITAVTDHEIEYLDSGRKSIRESRDSFLQRWSGIALLAEPGAAVETEHFVKREDKQQKAYRLFITALATALLIAIAVFVSLNTVLASAGFTILLLCKLAGVMVASLLLWYEADKFNPVLQKICSAGAGGSAKTDCNAVLNSKAARIFSFLSWSEAGFFYFAATFSVLLFHPDLIFVSIVALFDLVVLPYVLFSIVYQWLIVKQWCRLCLAIQAILLLECGVSLLFDFGGRASWSNLSLNSVGILALHMVAVITIWYWMKPRLRGYGEGKNKKYELIRLKANRDVFYSLLQRQKKINHPVDGLGIELGNPAATNTIIKVCNPYCGPCARAHPELDKLLHENDNLKVQIIFTASDREEDRRYFPVRHLMAINSGKDRKLVEKALDDWYLPDKKEYEVFAEKYPMNGELSMQNAGIRDMHAWCDAEGIEVTPTIFFNGYQLPELYTIADLKFILWNDIKG